MQRIFPWIFLFILGLAGLVVYAAFPAVSPETLPANAVIRFPWGEEAPAFKPLIKAVTYNIGYGSGKKNNLPVSLTPEEVRENLDAMVGELQKLNPDVLCLQEVDFQSARTFGMNQMEYLAKGLGLAHGAYVITWNKRYLPWPYWPPSVQYGKMVSGQAVLSRYPIRNQELVAFDKPKKNAFWYNWFYLDRIAQKLSIHYGEEPLRVWNIHLEAFAPPTRMDQAKILALTVQKDRWPYQLVLGDFNSVSRVRPDRVDSLSLEDQGEALNHFIGQTKFKNAEGEPSFYTMPSWDAGRKIDHVLYNEGFELKSVGSFQSTASDHLPVWAELEWIR